MPAPRRTTSEAPVGAETKASASSSFTMARIGTGMYPGGPAVSAAGVGVHGVSHAAHGGEVVEAETQGVVQARLQPHAPWRRSGRPLTRGRTPWAPGHGRREHRCGRVQGRGEHRGGRVQRHGGSQEHHAKWRGGGQEHHVQQRGGGQIDGWLASGDGNAGVHPLHGSDDGIDDHPRGSGGEKRKRGYMPLYMSRRDTTIPRAGVGSTRAKGGIGCGTNRNDGFGQGEISP
ncbi:uncharacterized protein [Triticum aestivum]|uniref:uncharacterized protein n=1 Tax=Triticum aestivum TaxID=4565 RepID=UPI001D00938A|nr:uncharacterized protein LOC123159398 [Triticum aestivum]